MSKKRCNHTYTEDSQPIDTPCEAQYGVGGAYHRPCLHQAAEPHPKTVMSAGSGAHGTKCTLHERSLQNRQDTYSCCASVQQETMRPAYRSPGMLSRRQVLVGAASSVALAALATSSMALSGCSSKQEGGSDATQANDASVANLGDYTLVEDEEAARLVYTVKLPLGTVVTSATQQYAGCLIRGKTSNPVTTGALYHFPSATQYDILSTPRNTQERRSIYDLYVTDRLVAWVEIEYATSVWELYASPISTDEDQIKASAHLVDKGSAEILPPAICAYQDVLVWTVSPHPKSTLRSQPSHAYAYKLGDTQGSEIVESTGQFGCDPTISSTGILVLSPRSGDAKNLQYQLIAYNINDSLAQINKMVMPTSVRPFAATYMADKFGICIEASYGYGGALGKMGTYFGSGNGPYVGLMQEPDAAPAFVNGSYVIKHRASLLVFDDTTGAYFRLTPPDGALDWGDYPVVRGESSYLATYATVKDPETSSPHEVVLRLFNLDHVHPAS